MTKPQTSLTDAQNELLLIIRDQAPLKFFEEKDKVACDVLERLGYVRTGRGGYKRLSDKGKRYVKGLG